MIHLRTIHRKSDVIQIGAYGTRTVVFTPYFAVIQAGDLRSYVQQKYDPYTIDIRYEYGEKYGENTIVNHRPGLQRNIVQIRPGYVENTVNKRPFTVRLRSFTEHPKLPLGFCYRSSWCMLDFYFSFCFRFDAIM